MIKIFVVGHKPIPYRLNEVYQTIQVNAEKNKKLEGYNHYDNHLVNISLKNDNYCELTASYWIWKNETKANYIGLCHYRRLFNFYNPIYNLNPSSQKRISLESFQKTKLYQTSAENTSQTVKKIFKNHDVILTKPYKLKYNNTFISLTDNYIKDHRAKDWVLTKQIIKDKSPEYSDSITSILDNGNTFHFANMIITSRKIWNEYYHWLFMILFELEKQIEIPTDDYQKRIFGFISERLLNLFFLHKNQFRIKQIPLYHINNI